MDEPVLSELVATQPTECASSNNVVDVQGFDVSSDDHVAVNLVVGVGQALNQHGGSDTAVKWSYRRSRMVSCLPQADRSVVSGPWSLELLCGQHHSEAGVVSSSRKYYRIGVRPKGRGSQVEASPQKRKKVNGVLRHSVYNLKKVARLPIKD